MAHLSKYVQVYNQILDMINRAQYPVGSKLPSEEQLRQDYQVSRVTLRTALSLLREDGVIQSKQGQGHFVQGSGLEGKVGLEGLDNPLLKSLNIAFDEREIYHRVNDTSPFTDRLFHVSQEPYYTLNIWYKRKQKFIANEFTIILAEGIKQLGIDLKDTESIRRVLEEEMYSRVASSELTITMSDRDLKSFKRPFENHGSLMLITEDVYSRTGTTIAQNKFYMPEKYFRTTLMRYPQAISYPDSTRP